MNTVENDEQIDQQTGEVFEPVDMAMVPENKGTTLNNALHKIISELPVWITQDSEANITEKQKRKYASLKAIMSVVRPIALKNGVRVRQGCDHAWQLDTGSVKGRAIPVFTDLIHTASGQFERTTIEIPVTRMDAQAMGSAISYGRRYGILAALGLTTDEAEDDGASTKSRDLLDQQEESPLLWDIKAELRDCESLKDLNTWIEKLKAGGRLEKLNDTEVALARVAFSDKRKVLEKAADEKAKPK